MCMVDVHRIKVYGLPRRPEVLGLMDAFAAAEAEAASAAASGGGKGKSGAAQVG